MLDRLRRASPLQLGTLAAVLLLATAVAVRFSGVVRPSDEARIAHNVEEYMTSDDPATCGYATTRYLEQATGLPGGAASAACFYPVGRESETGRRSVEVSEIDVGGDAATAVVQYLEGSLLEGSTQRVALVEENEVWKLDESGDILTLDRAGFEDEMAELLRGDSYDFPPESVECVLRRFAAMSDAEFEGALLDRDATPRTRQLVACDRGAMQRAEIAALREYGYPASLLHCISERSKGLSDAEYTQLGLDPVAYAEIAIECDRAAPLAAYREQLLAEGEYPEEDVDCVVSELRGLSDAELARTAVDGKAVDEIYESCGVD